MKLRTLAGALRNDPLPALMAEAGWRCTRWVRKAAFRLAGQGGDCPVRYHPIGYYRLQRQLLSAHARDAIVAYADTVLRGEYPLLGYGSPCLGFAPDWQRDWVSGKSWPLEPSSKIETVRLDGSDVKAPWELSRLQWAPVVAKAHLLTGEAKYRSTLKTLLTDWMDRNPVGQGVNWTGAMEAGLRAISLCLTLELLSPFTGAEQPWLQTMTAGLWQHLRFIEAHNEFSFLLRSNHYLSNLAGLTTLAACLKGPGMEPRRHRYARALQREVLLQTYADGGDREASTGYHVLVAQLALHSLVVQQRSGCTIMPEFQARLQGMFAWVSAVADDDGKLPHLGDCDNGRVELLAADLAQAVLPATERHSLRVEGLLGLASSLLQAPFGDDIQDAVWFGEASVKRPERQAVSLLKNSGIVVLCSGEASVVFCAMPNGLSGKGSHTHCDKLSFTLRLGAEEVFCDSGSRCYTRSAEQRNADRSTRAHTTLMIDGAEQNVLPADPRLLFQSGDEASVSEIVFPEAGATNSRASHRGYARFGIVHQRTMQLSERALEVVDAVSGAGEHSLDLRFMIAPEWSVSSEMMTGETVGCALAGPRLVTLVCEAKSELALTIAPASISREYGTGLAASCITIHSLAQLPTQIRTWVRWN